MGYVLEDRQGHPRAAHVEWWARTWGDSSNVVRVEFAPAREGGSSPFDGVSVLRINVSGETFVQAGGKRRRVREAASLRDDITTLARQLRRSFER